MAAGVSHAVEDRSPETASITFFGRRENLSARALSGPFATTRGPLTDSAPRRGGDAFTP